MGVVLFQLAQSAIHSFIRPIGHDDDGRDKLQRPKRMKPRHTKAPPPKHMQSVINRRTGGKQNILFFLSPDEG